jgi:hypothetical protein
MSVCVDGVNARSEHRERVVKEAKLPPFIRARELAKKLGINIKDITRRLTSEG